MLTRRGFIGGLIASPAIVRADNLMKVRPHGLGLKTYLRGAHGTFRNATVRSPHFSPCYVYSRVPDQVLRLAHREAQLPVRFHEVTTLVHRTPDIPMARMLFPSAEGATEI